MDEKKDQNEFDFWQDHSPEFLEMAFRTDRCERIEQPDGYGKNTGECGDTVEMFIMVAEEHVQTVAFMANGCLHTNACANTVALLAEGKPTGQAWKITPDTVADYLKTLPASHMHCAELAVGALYRALSDFQKTKQNPWKKTYRRY